MVSLEISRKCYTLQPFKLIRNLRKMIKRALFSKTGSIVENVFTPFYKNIQNERNHNPIIIRSKKSHKAY